MPSYLVQVAYTPDAWAAMVNQPQNRLEAVRPVVEKLGGKCEHAWLAFGEFNIVGVVELLRTPMPPRSRWPSRQEGPQGVQDHPAAERGRRSRGHAQGARGGVSSARRIAALSMVHSTNRAQLRYARRAAPRG